MDPAVLERLRHVPQEEYARRALKIVDKDGEITPLDCAKRPGQKRLAEAVQRQIEQDRPVRIILVKSRQFGGSTWIQGELMKRATTTPRRKILTVAQKLETAESLFAMGLTMWENLPENMRPAMGGFVNPTRGSKIMNLGEKIGGRFAWPNSRMAIDTAEELGGGRGITYTDLHLTECAHWRDVRKALALLPAVPKRPGTSIFLESTANGLNWFHTRYKGAMDGLSEFEPVFVGWWEDPDCVRPFMSAEARAEFVASIGDTGGKVGVVAEAEPFLVEEFDCTPEQLYFRRTAIYDECEGEVENFNQEYPATWDEAFIGSGNQVFSVPFTQRAIRTAEWWSKQPPEKGGPQRGLFVGKDPTTRVLSDGTVQVPTRVEWVPLADLTERVEWWPGHFWTPKMATWTRWVLPERTPEEWREAHERGEVNLGEMEAGMARALAQHVVTCDPAKDTVDSAPAKREKSAFSAVEVIDHRTGDQVAEWEGREDHDLIARHIFLAHLFFGRAWTSVERTGGWGQKILGDLRRRYYCTRIYQEKVLDDRKQREKMTDGWDTTRKSKPLMVASMQAMLREQTHGIRSTRLAGQLPTYVKDPDKPGVGNYEPSPGSHADCLMAYMQGQEIRLLKPVIKSSSGPDDGNRPNSMTRGFSY
jgi:hypothetical protein